MKKVYLLFAILAAVVTYFSCVKREPLLKDPVVTQMVKDVDVQSYFSLISDQLKQISLPYTQHLLDTNRVTPSKADFEAEAVKVTTTHFDETKYIMELGLTIRKRYDLAKLGEQNVRELFDKVLDEFAKSPKKHAVSRNDPKDAAFLQEKNNETMNYYARYQQAPETTNCVQYYLVTFYTDDPSTILNATPLFKTCTEVYNPYQTGSINYPFDTPDFASVPTDPFDTTGILKKLKYCHDDMMTKIQRCDRNADVTTGLITGGFIVGAGLALWISDGAAIKFSPQALASYAAALAGVIANCYLCKQDATTDYNTCVNRAYN